MPAKGKWSATTTTEGTCAFHTLRKSSQLQSPPSRPPWPTPALWATSRRETAVWVGVWFVGSGGLEVDRWPQDERSLRMFMCVWLCKFIVGGHRLRGTGGRSRCWDWRQHVSAICVGVSEYESKGGRQTDRQTDRQWRNLEDFTREQLLCFKNRTCGEKRSPAEGDGGSSACMRQQTWFNMMWYFQLSGANEASGVAVVCPPTGTLYLPVRLNDGVFAHNNHILTCVSLLHFAPTKHRHRWVWARRTRLPAQSAVYQLTGGLHLSVSGRLPQGWHRVHWWDHLCLSVCGLKYDNS